MDLLSSEFKILSDNIYIDCDQNAPQTIDNTNTNISTLHIPKSTSLNFELYNSSRQLLSANVKQSDEYKVQLTRADLEIERLKRQVQVLNQDISTAKTKIEYNEDKQNTQIHNDFKKWTSYFRNVFKQELSKAQETINMLREDNDLVKRQSLADIQSLRKQVTQLEGEIERLNMSKSDSSFDEFETNTEYYGFKKRVIDFDPNSVGNSTILAKLEELCQNMYLAKKKIEKQAEELDKRELLVESQRKDLIKTKSLLLSAELDNKKLETNYQEKVAYIEQMDGHWMKKDEKLREFECLLSNKQVGVVKELFRKFNECMLAVREISVGVIKNEKRVDTPLMRKNEMFSDLELGDEDSSLKLLDGEFLNDKLNEMKEVKQALEILKLELGISKNFMFNF